MIESLRPRTSFEGPKVSWFPQLARFIVGGVAFCGPGALRAAGRLSAGRPLSERGADAAGKVHPWDLPQHLLLRLIVPRSRSFKRAYACEHHLHAGKRFLLLSGALVTFVYMMLHHVAGTCNRLNLTPVQARFRSAVLEAYTAQFVLNPGLRSEMD